MTTKVAFSALYETGEDIWSRGRTANYDAPLAFAVLLRDQNGTFGVKLFLIDELAAVLA